jgi:hypothetical protein
MLRSFHYAPRFNERHPQMQPAGRPGLFWSAATALRAMWAAFREGLAVHRDYERLRSRGMSHDKALRESLGFGRRPHRHARGAARPLYCAGRA